VVERASELGSVYDKTNPQTETTQREVFHVRPLVYTELPFMVMAQQASQSVVTKYRCKASQIIATYITREKFRLVLHPVYVYYERVPDVLPELSSPKQFTGKSRKIRGGKGGVGSMAYEFPAPSEGVSRSIFEGVKVSKSM